MNSGRFLELLEPDWKKSCSFKKQFIVFAVTMSALPLLTNLIRGVTLFEKTCMNSGMFFLS